MSISLIEAAPARRVPTPRQVEIRRRSGRVPELPGLDGLRALSIAAVFAYHADAKWLPGGYLGVDVFFVISGYLITALLISEHQRTGTVSLRHFWKRRARRLLPALVMTLGMTVAAAVVFDPSGLAAARTETLAALFYVVNWQQATTHVSYFAQFGRPPLFRHLWSLSVEEQFYLLWPPLAIVALRRGRLRDLGLLAGCLAVASGMEMWLLAGSQNATRLYEGTDTRAATLLIGALGAVVMHPARTIIRPRVPLVIIDLIGAGCAAGLLAMMLSLQGQGPTLFRGPLQLSGLLALGLLVVATRSGTVIRWALSRRTIVWVGRRSYGIYLIHWPVIVLTRSANSGYGQSLWLTALQATITLLLAAGCFALIESPIRRDGLRGSLAQSREPVVIPTLRESLFSVAVASVAGLVLIPMVINTALGHGPGQPRGLSSREPTALHGALPSEPGRRDRLPIVGAKHPHRATAVGSTTMFFGDSVIIDTAPAFDARLGPHTLFNAAVGRQPQDTVAAVEATRSAGRLPSRVVISLGDNGLVTTAMLRVLQHDLRDVRDVVLVTPRVPDPWGPPSASVIRAAVDWWPGVRVADWERLSNDQDAWFTDGVHLSPSGVHAYVALVLKALASNAESHT